jgi:HD-like signal output (HDOD) protein
VDVILTDLRMPEMSGIEFLNRAVGMCAGAARVMLSGYEDKEVIIHSLAKGLAQHYIMKPWDDAGLRTLLRTLSVREDSMDLKLLRGIFGDGAALPVAPKFHRELAAILARDDAPLRDLVAEIEKNPPVVAKLLQVANSIYYAARRPVTTVREAVQFVGTEYIESLVLVIEAFQSLGRVSDPWVARQVDELWSVAVNRAGIAKTIAEQWAGFEGRQVVYVSSLFQDLGLVVRACAQPELFRRLIKAVTQDALPLADAEAQILGTKHDEVGAALLRHWNLPESIVRAVAGHQRLDADDQLITIMQVAGEVAGGPFGHPLHAHLIPLVAEWKERLQSTIAPPQEEAP